MHDGARRTSPCKSLIFIVNSSCISTSAAECGRKLAYIHSLLRPFQCTFLSLDSETWNTRPAHIRYDKILRNRVAAKNTHLSPMCVHRLVGSPHLRVAHASDHEHDHPSCKNQTHENNFLQTNVNFQRNTKKKREGIENNRTRKDVHRYF